MNYSIWDEVEKAIESSKNEKTPESSEFNLREPPSELMEHLSPTGTCSEPKSSQNASERHIEPLFDEAAIWQGQEDLIAAAPEEARIPLRLGFIEEFILQGLRTEADRTALFLAAVKGIALANNDGAFFREVQQAVSNRI